MPYSLTMTTPRHAVCMSIPRVETICIGYDDNLGKNEPRPISQVDNQELDCG